jgi:hypothetical protein
MTSPVSVVILYMRWRVIGGYPSVRFTRFAIGCPVKTTGFVVIDAVEPPALVSRPVLAIVLSHSEGVVESPVAGNAYVRAHESTGVSVVPTSASVSIPVISYSLQNVGACVLQVAPDAQFSSYGMSGQLAAVELLRVEVAHPVLEVEQRPLAVNSTSAPGWVE